MTCSQLSLQILSGTKQVAIEYMRVRFCIVAISNEVLSGLGTCDGNKAA